VLLGVIEALGSVFLSAAYKDLNGFRLLLILLVFRPTGLFGERERTVLRNHVNISVTADVGRSRQPAFVITL
jgi:hypothetical protein